ncbi:uncharacterized protein IL334_007278 [Kwoniella shivajii]|uniref:Sfi1 spindle body domain-containing protein n=1 Tax=Kwoniella shivajii TaxID=564305 RepID=A0ABZ1DAC9_9TREE|nr:hypothetical protein IL334_007278 [Kwoniella shivajii]
MLATSSTSSRSKSTLTDSTSILSNVDLEIVERIFERGKYATSFPQIFRPYTEVLQECGISPTNDSTYYGFLLKVGVIKAPTWGDKWTIWKSTLSNSTSQPSHSSRSIEKDYGGSYDSYEGRSPISSYPQSQLPSLRARVPFLASASSDIDEGFAESVLDGSLLQPNRPSPRKELYKKDKSRSLVGFTPDQSFVNDPNQDDELDFVQPIRTSTPVFRSPDYRRLNALEGGGGGIHIDPPAYSASDISQALEETTEDFSALGLGLSTPKQDKHEVFPQLTWIDRIDELSEDERRVMEKRANEFYKFGLLGRCWDMWFKTSEFYRVTYNNIPIARDNLLLRQVLENWSRSTRYQLSLPNTADGHRRIHLESVVLRKWIQRLKEKKLRIMEMSFNEDRRIQNVKKIFKNWNLGAQKRRTERWKLDMAEKELLFVQKRDRGKLRETLTYWRIETRGRLAEADVKRRVVHVVLNEWQYLAQKQKELRTISYNIEKQKLRSIFDAWKRKFVFRPREDEIRERRESILVRKVWGDWRISSWQARQSITFDRRRLLLMVVDKWRTTRQRNKTMERKASIYDRTSLLDKTFRGWKLESWARLLIHTKEKRSQQRLWLKWKDRISNVARLGAISDEFVFQHERLKLQSVFSHWRSSTSTRQTNHLRAILIHERNFRLTLFSKWRASTETIKTNIVLADKAHAFFLLRTAFTAWRVEDAKRKGERWLEDRNKAKLQEVFTKWKSQSDIYRDLRSREMVMRDQANVQILKTSLGKWTNRVIEVKDLELRVARARDDHSLSNALMVWRTKLLIVQVNQKKANDSLEIRESENLRRVVRSWRGKAKREKRLRLTAEASLIEREERLVRSVFDRWYEKKRDTELQDIENEIAFLHENVILYGVMDKWKASTEILPGITANTIRLKRKVVGKWSIVLERKKKAKVLQRERDQRLISEAFALWKDVTARKAAMNVRRLRGRSRPSALSDRGFLSGLPLPPSQRFITHDNFGSRRITSNSSSTQDSHGARIPSGRLSPNNPNINSTETVHSEPVYSRLRSELGISTGAGRRRRGGSEEPEVVQYEWQTRKQEEIHRPRSGSEMIKALRGNIPGR